MNNEPHAYQEDVIEVSSGGDAEGVIRSLSGCEMRVTLGSKPGRVDIHLFDVRVEKLEAVVLRYMIPITDELKAMVHPLLG